MALHQVTYVLSDGGRAQSSYPDETKDCVIRAVVHATEISYDKIHSLFEKFGRENRKGTRDSVGKFKRFNRNRLGYKFVQRKLKKSITLRRLLTQKRYKHGTFLVHIPRHVLCVKEGLVLDSYKPPQGSLVSMVHKVIRTK